MLEQRRVMSRDDEQVGLRFPVEFGQAGVVVAHPLSIECDRRLHCPQATRHVGVLQRAVVVEGVTAVQHPAVAGVDGDACMTAGMTGQRDEDDAGSDLVEFLRRRESAPGFSVRTVFDNGSLGCPLLAAVADLLLEGGCRGDSECLRGGYVNSRVRKIRDAADVIRVEVGDNDVADVLHGGSRVARAGRRRSRWGRTPAG